MMKYFSPHFLLLLAALLFAIATQVAAQDTGQLPLRVCADPNNLPYSNVRQEGFENRLAALLAAELDRKLEYTWWPQRRGFLRHTLDAGECDMVMGVPGAYSLTSTSTPYYRSGYVAVTRAEDALAISTLEDPRLRRLAIGVHTIGDDYTNPPPAQILARFGIRENVHGYSLYGDYSQVSPPGQLIEAVAAGEIDVALAWGPIAGYFAASQSTPLQLTLLEDVYALPLSFDIALGFRLDDDGLRNDIDGILNARQEQVRQLLTSFHIPLLDPGPDTRRKTL